jgi:hypothetical protein
LQEIGDCVDDIGAEEEAEAEVEAEAETKAEARCMCMCMKKQRIISFSNMVL